jgi:precorrin-6A/cobalt-precorrin-6A reductase
VQYATELGKRLWLIGGTTESAELAAAIARAHLPCTITVTTEAARSLYPPVPGLRVIVGRLELEKLEHFFQEQNIVAILDASHPYAVEVSHAAIATASQQQIPYLRYERPAVKAISSRDSSPVIQLDSFEQLLAADYLQDQRVLLTIGYKPLVNFQPWQNRSTLFARILPSVTALTAAAKAGFTSDRLLAMRPPVPVELEKALWRYWNISMVVTKASGTPGGEDIKRDVAAELGISLIVITRPDVDYPQQTSNLSEALEFCRQYL